MGVAGRSLRRTTGLLGVAVVIGAVSAAPAVAGPVGSATTEAVAAARADGLRVAVAVTDTTTGTTTTAGEAGAAFPSESVVKVVIAARLIVDGRLTGEVETLAASMISASDDDAANTLWGLVGGPEVVEWVTDRYGVTGLGEPSAWNWWGNTQVTALGLAALYTALLDDPAVAPWLVGHLAAMTPTAADGTDQTFGFGLDDSAALKQGWGNDDSAQSTANLLSTGYLADERYAVAVIVQDPDGGPLASLVPTIDAVATAVVADTAAAGAGPLDREQAADEVVSTVAPPTDPVLGGASARVDTGAWWPMSVGILGSAALLGVATVAFTAGQRRRATARRS